MAIRRVVLPVDTGVRPDMLTLRLEHTVQGTVIEAAGDLDIATSHLLTDLAGSLLHPQPPRVIVLDLAKLRFFCADGIRALLRVRDAAAARAVPLIVRDPSPAVLTVLTITDMLSAFRIEAGPDGTVPARPRRTGGILEGVP